MDHLAKIVGLSLVSLLLIVLTLCRLPDVKTRPPLYKKINGYHLLDNAANHTALHKAYVAAMSLGGLGNQMFIYAALYSMAKKTRRIPYLCGNYNMSVLFHNLTINFHNESICKQGSRLYPDSSLNLTQAHSSIYYDPALQQKIQNSNNTHIFICCFLQNIGFFLDYLQDLEVEFTLAHSQKHTSNLYLSSQLQKYKTALKIQNDASILRSDMEVQFVGIHVRRTDMLSYIPGLNSPNASYFNKAMNYFRTKYSGHVLFIVSSDDLKWCHDNIKGPDVVFTGDSGQKSREEDFSIQVSCNHSIISVGTFGWWIGFLSKGEVFVYKDWVGTSGHAKWYHPGQRYPVHWKVI